MKFLKYITIFIFIISCNSQKVYAQKLSGKIIYKYRVYNDYFLKLDSLEGNQNERVKDAISQINESLTNYQDFFDFSLIFDESSSNYFWNDMLQNDGMANMKFAKILTDSNSIYYSSLKDSIILEERDFLGKKIIIKRLINDTHWKLLNDSKKIGNYTCFKATTIKKSTKKNIIVEAWYTPQIPNSFGPKGYNGLLGLILELKEGNIIYYVSKLKFNSKIKINKPTEGEVMSVLQFQNFLIDFDKSKRNR